MTTALAVDELGNTALRSVIKAGTASRGELDEELVRVKLVISGSALTGAELTYWFDRQEILEG